MSRTPRKYGARMAHRQGLDSIPPEETLLAAAKLVGGLTHLNQRKVNVEENSVYGAAILLPQIARSASWGTNMAATTVAAYFYLFFTMSLHALLVCYISKEESIMDGFSGQMFLCDFGTQKMETCTGDCLGPGGTVMTPARLYDWEQFSARSFHRDSLKAVFPDQAADMGERVDPGEYGAESWYARILCCLIFILTIMDELELIWNMLKLLYYVPSHNEPWIRLDPAAERSNESGRWRDEVIVQVAGMSPFWKVTNLIVVFFPKLVLWILTANAGIVFLMESGSIEGVIVNSIALSFLLTMDELVMDNLMSQQTNWILGKCTPYIIDRNDETLSEQELLEKHSKGQHTRYPVSLGWNLLCEDSKFILAVLISAFFICLYYFEHCEFRNGRWISLPVFLPKSMSYGPLKFFLPHFFPVAFESEPCWTYPGEQG